MNCYSCCCSYQQHEAADATAARHPFATAAGQNRVETGLVVEHSCLASDSSDSLYQGDHITTIQAEMTNHAGKHAKKLLCLWGAKHAAALLTHRQLTLKRKSSAANHTIKILCSAVSAVYSDQRPFVAVSCLGHPVDIRVTTSPCFEHSLVKVA